MDGFARSVRLFSVGMIGLIGNCDNGCVIGLTTEGVRDCTDFGNSIIDIGELERRQPELVYAFRRYGFLDEGCFYGKGSLRSAYLHVTDRCNMDCVGCYSRSDGRNKTPDLPFADLCAIIDKLASLGIQRLHLSGGEPALRCDLCAIAEHAKKAGITWVDLATNGLLAFSDFDLDRLSACIDDVFVSVDGLPDGANRRIRIESSKQSQLRAICILRSNGLNVTMLPTIHAKNIDDIPTYLNLADKLKVRISFSMLSCSACNRNLEDLGFTKKDLLRIAHFLDIESARGGKKPVLSARLSCGAGKTMVSVSADGGVYPCHMLQAPEFCIGNMLHDPLVKIVESHVRQEFLDLTVESVEECSSCTYAYLCGGGCRARAFAEEGLLKKDPYCRMLQEHYANVVRRIEETLGG